MEKENILGTEKIGKLIRKFSIPCIISMLVNSLYNIVDQIFIGIGVGYLGNGATNIVFPFTVICLAFALMIGDGSSAYLSLKLGEKKKEEAAKGVCNGLIIGLILAVVFFVISFTFLPQFLNLFGCTDALRPYALDYGYIIICGLPFMMIGTILNGIIRADGSPKYSMISMLSGAILNVILDPIFIFVLDSGVKGAAIATIISQIVSFLINICYIKKFKTIKIVKKNFKLKFGVIAKVLALGISSFINQMTFVFLIAIQNNLLKEYGSVSKFGSEIPLTVIGIVMKINQILTSIILGISVGAQPIIGYNYGAKNYDRVKKALKFVLILSVCISTFAFILFQTIPDKLILIFGSGDENYIEFACLTFRIYLMLCICVGVQMPSGIFFQAIGKSTKSAILSLSRQILLLIPAMIILGKYFGLIGVLYGGPVADGISFLLASTFLILEIKNMGKEKVESRALIDDTRYEPNKDRHIVVTVSREYGSGGRYVGRLIADILGIKFYDKDFITRLSKDTGLSEEYIEQNEQKKEFVLKNGYYNGLSNADELFIQESNLIKKIAKEESCVIIGRCADFILKDRKDVIKVFIYSDLEKKIKRIKKYYGLNEKKAEKEIRRIDKLREEHYKYYTGADWKNFSNYDICINSDYYGVEKTAEMICKMIDEKVNIK